MREMKDSGIEWIGEIPKEWGVVRVKEKYKFNSGFTPETSHQEYYNDVDGYEWATISDLNNGKIDNPTKSTISREFVKFNHKKQIPSGCVLYSFKLTVGQVAVNDRPIFTNEAIMSFYPEDETNLNFFKYSASLIEYSSNTNIYGAKILNQQLISNAYIVYPPFQEQSRIASFLDSKCSEIDSLHSDIEEEIETLKEYKKSVITEAVTKGLNPDTDMKDSGIEWIGEIPKEWDVNRLKYIFEFTKGLSITKENLIEEGLPVISYGQIHSKENTGVDIKQTLLRYVSFDYLKNNRQSEVEQNSFVFADTSEDYEGCGNFVYKRDDSLLYGGYHAIILHSIEKKDNRYFAYLFLTDLWRKQVREIASGVKVFSITQKNLMNCSVIIPKYDEQQQIADYLDSKCFEIDSIIESKQQQLETLEQYKKSLIYEYVTGKKKVPYNA